MVTGYKNRILIGLCGSMELSWLFAWALFLVSATAGAVAFPFILSGLLFGMALLLSGYQDRKGYKRIWKVAAHFLLLVLMIAMALRSTGLTLLSGSIYDVYQACLVSLLMTGFWYKGQTLALRTLSYETVCSHFDLGVAAILALMILNLLIVIKGGQTISEQSTLIFAVVFFICAVTAFFLARNSGSGQKKYQNGFELSGILIGAGMVLLLSGTGAWLFFRSGLNQMTREGYDVFVQAAVPLKPYIIGILKAILSVSGNSPKSSSSPGKSNGMTWGDFDMPDYSVHWIDSVAGYVFAGLAILMMISIIIILGVVLYRWLMSGGPGKSKGPPGRSLLQTIFRWPGLIRLFLIRCMTRNRDGIDSGYHALIRWGHRSGMPMKINETPLEYGLRLSDRFAPLGREFHTIIHFFCLKTYGQKKISKESTHTVRVSVKLIRHPRFWPLRIKSFFR